MRLSIYGEDKGQAVGYAKKGFIVKDYNNDDNTGVRPCLELCCSKCSTMKAWQGHYDSD